MRTCTNILVTGGAGFIGSAFIRYLLLKKEFAGSIINFDSLTYAANLNWLKGFENNPRYHFIQADICNAKAIELAIEKYEVDTIVHFAAESHVDRSIHSARAFIETNVKGTLTLLEALRNFPYIHFHHISTDEVYGSLGESGYFNERSNYRPNSPYSASKAASDHLVRAFANTYGIATTISHCSNNYGPRQYPEKFIPLMITNLMQKKTLPVYGKGANVRDWIFVEDHVEAIWLVLQRGRKGETYDIGGSEELSNLELLHLIIELFSEKVPGHYHHLIRFVQDRLGHDYRYSINTEKIQKEIGWSAKTDLRSGLKTTISWYLKKFSTSCAPIK